MSWSIIWQVGNGRWFLGYGVKIFIAPRENEAKLIWTFRQLRHWKGAWIVSNIFNDDCRNLQIGFDLAEWNLKKKIVNIILTSPNCCSWRCSNGAQQKYVVSLQTVRHSVFRIVLFFHEWICIFELIVEDDTDDEKRRETGFQKWIGHEQRLYNFEVTSVFWSRGCHVNVRLVTSYF